MATDDEPICEPLEYSGDEPVPTSEHEPVPTSEPLSIPATANGKNVKSKLKKTRRGWGSKGKKLIKFTVFCNNANGLKGKKESFINSIKKFGSPSCILIQESKLRFPGTFKLQGYQIFEKTRAGLGGGLLTAINEDLSPVLISQGSDEIEILVVQILVGKHKIRILNGYGPQENEMKGNILSFWQEFEKEIIMQEKMTV